METSTRLSVEIQKRGAVHCDATKPCSSAPVGGINKGSCTIVLAGEYALKCMFYAPGNTGVFP
jgi:hypothetical protein